MYFFYMLWPKTLLSGEWQYIGLQMDALLCLAWSKDSMNVSVMGPDWNLSASPKKWGQDHVNLLLFHTKTRLSAWVTETTAISLPYSYLPAFFGLPLYCALVCTSWPGYELLFSFVPIVAMRMAKSKKAKVWHRRAILYSTPPPVPQKVVRRDLVVPCFTREETLG